MNLNNLSIEELEAMLEQKKQNSTLVLPDVDARNKPLGTINNSKHLFSHYNINIRHNEMTKDVEIDIPGKTFFKDTELNAKLVVIKDLAIQHGLPPQHVLDAVLLVANENPYHPVRDWIDSQVWDGKSRLQDFYNTIEENLDSHLSPQEYHELKEIMMRKWALSAVAALYHPNFSCEGVLCLYGDQAAGKTSWAESLIPAENKHVWIKDAVILDPKDKDSVMKSVSTWITELGELDATFRRSDIEAIKGFVTEKVDKLRPPYERKMNSYDRKTVFYGTINREEFLQDRENRRFWVIDVKKVNFNSLEVAQFWAEVKNLYLTICDKISTPLDRIKNNEYGWFLSPDERSRLQRLQNPYKSINPVEQVLQHNLLPPGAITNGEWLNCTTILQRLGVPHGSKEANAASIWLKDGGYQRRTSDKYYHVEFRFDDTEVDHAAVLRSKTKALNKRYGH